MTTYELFMKDNVDGLLDIIKKQKQVKEYTEQLNKMRQEFWQKMEASNIKKIVHDDLLINRVLSSSTSTFNRELFKKDYPDLYDEYTSCSYKDGYLIIRRRKK